MLNTHGYVSLGPCLCITVVVPANNDLRRKKLPEIVATMIHCRSAPLRRSQQATTLTRHRKWPIENRSCAGLWTITIFRCACFVNIASFIQYYCDFATNLRSGNIFIFYKETSASSFSPIELNQLDQGISSFWTFPQVAVKSYPYLSTIGLWKIAIQKHTRLRNKNFEQRFWLPTHWSAVEYLSGVLSCQFRIRRHV